MLVEIDGGETIVASITMESVAALGVKTGGKAVVLVKAPQIVVVADFDGYKISARNQLTGQITEIKPGAVNSEIDIALKGGQKLAATVTVDSVSSLGLQAGQTVTAVFKASVVLLAIPA